MRRWIKNLILSVLSNFRHILCSQALDQSNIKPFVTTKRRVSGTRTNTKRKSNEQNIGRCELDSHANTILDGSNCVILRYTGNKCNLNPYRDDYKSVSNIPIVHADTAWQSAHTGQTYILVFNESLWMGNHMDRSLINPKQSRYYGIKVQDNPILDTALSIITEENEFCMELAMAGTVIYDETFTPSEKEPHQCPHIILSSPHAWNPQNVVFPRTLRTLEEEMGTLRHVIAMDSTRGDIKNKDIIEEWCLA